MNDDPGTAQRAPNKLFVLRHAKSSWDDPELSDHDRPLAPRGHRAAKVIGEHIRASGLEPDLVLCSSSRRTRETLELVNPSGERMIEPELYAASAATVIGRLRQVPKDTTSVMMIGHNPAMQQLVLQLAGTSAAAADAHAIDEVRRKFPTGALAALTFDCAWGELSPGSARLTSFVRPKQLSRT
jgi:phosphohistidine phosphatase